MKEKKDFKICECGKPFDEHEPFNDAGKKIYICPDNISGFAPSCYKRRKAVSSPTKKRVDRRLLSATLSENPIFVPLFKREAICVGKSMIHINDVVVCLKELDKTKTPLHILDRSLRGKDVVLWSDVKRFFGEVDKK